MDIAVLRSLNIRIVLVHGASAQIKLLAADQGVTPSDLDGAGITDEATLKLALTAANRLSHEILEGLSACDLRAACTNAVTAHPLGILHGMDHLLTGKVERIDVELCQKLLDNGIVPVLPPLGFDGDGKTYRVNSDSIALAVAEALRATKIIFLCEHGALKVGDQLVRQLSMEEAEDLVKKGKICEADGKGLCLKLEAAARACRQGVPRVHLLDGHINEALLAELFSSEGIGTM